MAAKKKKVLLLTTFTTSTFQDLYFHFNQSIFSTSICTSTSVQNVNTLVTSAADRTQQRVFKTPPFLPRQCPPCVRRVSRFTTCSTRPTPRPRASSPCWTSASTCCLPSASPATSASRLATDTRRSWVSPPRFTKSSLSHPRLRLLSKSSPGSP